MTDNLDKLLKDWSSHTATDDKALAGLERSIATGMREASHRPSVVLPEAATFSPWGRLAWFALGAATALAVALSFVRIPAPPNGVHAPELVQTSESVRRLFDEVNRLFAGNLKWIAQSDGAVELGISPDQDEFARDGEPFAVHIAVVSRAGNEGPWKKVWESDILTRSEQAIDIAPNQKRDDRIGLWIYPVADGRFAVDSRLSLNAPVRIYSDSSDVVEDGKPVPIAVMTVGDRQYRVYQTVTRLKANVGSIHNQEKSTTDYTDDTDERANVAWVHSFRVSETSVFSVVNILFLSHFRNTRGEQPC